MRPLSTLPLSLSVLLLPLLSLSLNIPSSALALTHTSAQPLQSTPAPLWVHPRFLPPAREKRNSLKFEKRQATDSAAVVGDTTTDAAATSAAADSAATTTAAADTTTAAATTDATTDAATTTSDPATTTEAATTTQATTQATTTDQTTSASPAATTTSDTAATTTTNSPSDSTSASATTTDPSSSSSSSTTSSTDSKSSSSGSTSDSKTTSASKTSSAPSSTISSVKSTFTSTYTDSNGATQTSTGTTQVPTTVAVKQNTSSSTGRTWGIIGGVVGGVIVVGALVFVVFRMTQRRFSSLDNDDADIKWPALQEDGLLSGNTSTLKPLDTNRTTGAGIGDDGDGSQWGGDMGAVSIYGDHRRNPSQGTLLGYGAMQQGREASYEHLAMQDGGGQYAQQHYDPFAGQGYPGPAAGGNGMVYPPPSFYPFSHNSQHHPSPSVDSSGEGPFGPNAGQRHSYANSFGSSAEAHGAGAAVPRGAPGAGGAYRVASPPIGERADSPFRVTSSVDEEKDEKGDEEKWEHREHQQGPL